MLVQVTPAGSRQSSDKVQTGDGEHGGRQGAWLGVSRRCDTGRWSLLQV